MTTRAEIERRWEEMKSDMWRERDKVWKRCKHAIYELSTYRDQVLVKTVYFVFCSA